MVGLSIFEYGWILFIYQTREHSFITLNSGRERGGGKQNIIVFATAMIKTVKKSRAYAMFCADYRQIPMFDTQTIGDADIVTVDAGNRLS